eukprot:1216912-Heterocapsa_arctica.AAC.1
MVQFSATRRPPASPEITRPVSAGREKAPRAAPGTRRWTCFYAGRPAKCYWDASLVTWLYSPTQVLCILM